MEKLIETFYIDWKLLIAQGVNFLIVMAVLYYYGIRPLMKLMHERSARIDEGLKNAEIIEENMKKAEIEKQKEIKKGRKEGQQLILEAEKQAEEMRRQKIDKTKKEAEKIVNEARLEIVNQRQKMMHEVKSELGELVLLASGKIASQTIDQKKHQQLINQVIDELKNS